MAGNPESPSEPSGDQNGPVRAIVPTYSVQPPPEERIIHLLAYGTPLAKIARLIRWPYDDVKEFALRPSTLEAIDQTRLDLRKARVDRTGFYLDESFKTLHELMRTAKRERNRILAASKLADTICRSLAQRENDDRLSQAARQLGSDYIQTDQLPQEVQTRIAEIAWRNRQGKVMDQDLTVDSEELDVEAPEEGNTEEEEPEEPADAQDQRPGDHEEEVAPGGPGELDSPAARPNLDSQVRHEFDEPGTECEADFSGDAPEAW